MTIDDRTLPASPTVPPLAAPAPAPSNRNRPRLGIRDQMPPLGLTEYWYPAVAAAKVGRRKPLRRQLLGQDVVFFRGKKGNIVALTNWCPHRNASLGAGQCIFAGTITCPYHGLTFDETGATVAFLGEGAKSKFVERGKAVARSYPTRTLKGLVFVWMGDGDPAPIEEDVPPEFFDESALVQFSEQQWQANWRPALENLQDAHAFFVHRNSVEVLSQDVSGLNLLLHMGPDRPPTKIVNSRALVFENPRFFDFIDSHQERKSTVARQEFRESYPKLDGALWPRTETRLKLARVMRLPPSSPATQGRLAGRRRGMGAGRAPAHHVPAGLPDPHLLPRGHAMRREGELGLLLQHHVPEEPSAPPVPSAELPPLLQLEAAPELLRPGQAHRRGDRLRAAAGALLLLRRLPAGVPAPGRRARPPTAEHPLTAHLDAEVLERRAAMQLVVLERLRIADGVVLLRLGHPEGLALPQWQPGAHLEIVLPSGLIRHYSLCGDPDDPFTYLVAVLRVADGDGGSREIHDTDLEGLLLEIRGPRNNFALAPADRYQFIAGGIGITPISAMVREIAGSDRPWRLVYGGRSRSSMAFLSELGELGPVQLVPQDEQGLPDLAGELGAAAAGTAVYACGPPAMLEVVTKLCANRPDLTLRLERFTTDGSTTPIGGAAFEVELRRTGIVLEVPADRSLLDVVRDVVRTQPYSCAEGICGTCETDVLEGIPDHHDDVLSDAERASNKTMMLCVSRSKSPRLVLEL